MVSLACSRKTLPGSFAAKSQAEEYTFFCSYPGHSALMKGSLSVK